MATRPDGAIPRRAMATYHDFLRSLLSDRDRFFEEVVEGVGLRSKLRYAVVTIVALSGFFGLVAGAYSGPAQAVSAAVKLPFLFFATFAVCFPAFFVVQVLVGSRLRLLRSRSRVCCWRRSCRSRRSFSLPVRTTTSSTC